ncbi:hypothetical protein CBM2585_A210025 [Cupriavidus taiwanensis]|nr:hypothetical protein CBM2585_A210025 [Cupriavidus taiwanensis]
MPGSAPVPWAGAAGASAWNSPSLCGNSTSGGGGGAGGSGGPTKSGSTGGTAAATLDCAGAGTVTLAAGAASPAISAASGSSVAAGAAVPGAAVSAAPATAWGVGAAAPAVTVAGTAGRAAMRGGCKAVAGAAAADAESPVCAQAARPHAASTAKPRRRSGTPRPAQALGPRGIRGSRREQAGNGYGNGYGGSAGNDDIRQRGSGGGTVFYQPRPFDRKPGYKIHHTVRRLTLRKTAEMAQSTSENPHLRGAPCRKGHRYNRLACLSGKTALGRVRGSSAGHAGHAAVPVRHRHSAAQAAVPRRPVRHGPARGLMQAVRPHPNQYL